MASLFADLPEALENTVELAKRCNLELQFDEYFLPDFPTPDGQSVEEFLKQASLEGLSKRLNAHGPAHDFTDDDYRARLDMEFEVINGMGFPGYFLIVADFIRWAKNNDIPVGPGRGSGAGSLVAYALEITDIDPLQFDLLFERFLNPERISMPDFDVDFCMEKRDLVIDYVAETYGRDQVSQIIT
jgi:DNA polymerase-3 subunit alpha